MTPDGVGPLATVLLLTSCTHCNDHGALVDSGVPPSDAAALDGGIDAFATDGGLISDWPGWRRLTEVDPTCHVDVPTSSTSLPSVTWIACVDGRPSCLQVDTTAWNDHASTINFGVGRMSEGLSYLLLLGRPVINPTDPVTATFESDFIDVVSWKTVAGFRFGGAGNTCSGNFAASKSFAVFAMQPITKAAPLQIDRRPLSQVADTAFKFVATDVNPWTQLGQSQTQEMWTSDATLAFDLQPVGMIGRVEGAATHVALTSNTPLTFPIVVGSDVYAIDQSGINGWSRIMRVDSDGSMTPYRDIPNHRVATPASDGTTMYWTECYGTTNPTSDTQPNVELWSAPYTNDPATLATTAQKVANLGTSCIYDLQQLAQNGLFFASSGLTNYVYRKTDGKLLTFTNGPSSATWYPLYISQNEYWSIESVQGGPKGVVLTRLQLAPW